MSVQQHAGMQDMNCEERARHLKLIDNGQTNHSISPANGLQQKYAEKVNAGQLDIKDQLRPGSLTLIHHIRKGITKTAFFFYAVIKFIFSAITFMPLLIKFLFTQKHWTN